MTLERRKKREREKKSILHTTVSVNCNKGAEAALIVMKLVVVSTPRCNDHFPSPPSLPVNPFAQLSCPFSHFTKIAIITITLKVTKTAAQWHGLMCFVLDKRSGTLSKDMANCEQRAVMVTVHFRSPPAKNYARARFCSSVASTKKKSKPFYFYFKHFGDKVFLAEFFFVSVFFSHTVFSTKFKNFIEFIIFSLPFL